MNAAQWWKSLPPKKKAYLKKHCKLTSSQAISEFYKARVQETVKTFAFSFGATK